MHVSKPVAVLAALYFLTLGAAIGAALTAGYAIELAEAAEECPTFDCWE